MTVADDGRGFDPERLPALPARGHVGIAAVVDRVGASGGHTRIESAPGAGTRVVVRLPVERRVSYGTRLLREVIAMVAASRALPTRAPPTR